MNVPTHTPWCRADCVSQAPVKTGGFTSIACENHCFVQWVVAISIINASTVTLHIWAVIQCNGNWWLHYSRDQLRIVARRNSSALRNPREPHICHISACCNLAIWILSEGCDPSIDDVPESLIHKTARAIFISVISGALENLLNR